jgi:hypothetical protein
MARNVTAKELRNISGNKSVGELQKSIRASYSTTSATAFLSHSSKDKELVAGAMVVLHEHGANVYIDEIDPEMPPYTTEETAALLKKRIKETQRFVLLTTENSKDSRWVPWELGIADGTKGLGKIALFPANSATLNDDWSSSEYLGLYHQIVWGRFKGNEDEVWMVLNKKTNTGTHLKQWLAGY